MPEKKSVTRFWPGRGLRAAAARAGVVPGTAGAGARRARGAAADGDAARRRWGHSRRRGLLAARTAGAVQGGCRVSLCEYACSSCAEPVGSLGAVFLSLCCQCWLLSSLIITIFSVHELELRERRRAHVCAAAASHDGQYDEVSACAGHGKHVCPRLIHQLVVVVVDPCHPPQEVAPARAGRPASGAGGGHRGEGASPATPPLTV